MLSKPGSTFIMWGGKRAQLSAANVWGGFTGLINAAFGRVKQDLHAHDLSMPLSASACREFVKHSMAIPGNLLPRELEGFELQREGRCSLQGQIIGCVASVHYIRKFVLYRHNFHFPGRCVFVQSLKNVTRGSAASRRCFSLPLVKLQLTSA